MEFVSKTCTDSVPDNGDFVHIYTYVRFPRAPSLYWYSVHCQNDHNLQVAHVLTFLMPAQLMYNSVHVHIHCIVL